jgi:hypothetical protein
MKVMRRKQFGKCMSCHVSLTWHPTENTRKKLGSIFLGLASKVEIMLKKCDSYEDGAWPVV